MEEITIFIITTMYNARKCLKKTLDSLLVQTKTNFIHYIYDDASKENCDDIINDYIDNVKKLNNPFKVIYEKGSVNLGCDKAHEYVFKKMTGTHVMWLDQGDYLAPKCIEIVSQTIRKCNDYDWFHLNGIHYDISSGKITSKPDNKRYKKKYLYAEDQLPPWVFGEFYYHLFVISIKSFNDAFCGNIEIVDKDKHGGCFYDAQIVLRLLATNKKMYYIKPLITYIMVDSKSVSSGFFGDSLIADQCIVNILNSNHRYHDFMNFYLPYKDKVRKITQTHLLCKTKDGLVEAKLNYIQLKDFLSNKNKPISSFFVKKNKYMFILAFCSLPFIRKIL